MANDKALTGRELLHALIRCENLDAPVTGMNINSNEDEFEGDGSAAVQEIVSVNDNTDNEGDIVIYYLGDTPKEEDDIS